MIHRGASDVRLMGRLPPLVTQPDWDWTRDSQILAARAENLVGNDPFAAAMVAAKLAGTHGPRGLRMRSLAYSKRGGAVTNAERELRKTIEFGSMNWYTRACDADGLMNRKELDLALDWLATVRGEGFAVRVKKPGRLFSRYATCWRLVRPERVSNPDDKPNSDTLYHGFQLDSTKQTIGIWVEVHELGPYGLVNKRTWQYVPWYAPDGTANVVHRIGIRMPGARRGLTMFAPMLLLAKQMAGVLEAHVVGKRAQACTPVIYYVDDPEEAAKAHAAAYGSDARVTVVGPHTMFDPMTVYYAKHGQQVQFTNTNYQGTDLTAFMELGYRLDCGMWQLPVEVVLAQMGKSSLSSARAGLDQFDRTCQGWAEDHEEQVSKPIDRSYIAEMELLGEITAGPAGIEGLAACRYSRPPKYSTDRKKDADTMEAWIRMGRSKTAVYAEFGYNYEDEVEERIRDDLFEREARRAAGLTDIETNPNPKLPDAKAPAELPEPKPTDDANDDKDAENDGENREGENSSPADGDT